MSCEQRISPHAAIPFHSAPNHDSRKCPEVLILHEIIFPRINTYKIPEKSRISFIRITFKSTRINTSGAKDLKSIRINTSGNKDLKSFRINTSKKHGMGVGIAPFPAFSPGANPPKFSLQKNVVAPTSLPARASASPPPSLQL
jgi:hypothetical protein